MADKWTLEDHTNGVDRGYFEIKREGVRIADAFPYAAKANSMDVISWAAAIVEAMNDWEERAERESAA